MLKNNYLLTLLYKMINVLNIILESFPADILSFAWAGWILQLVLPRKEKYTYNYICVYNDNIKIICNVYN